MKHLQPIQNGQICNKINPISEYYFNALSYFNKSTRLRDCLAYSSDCTRGIDEPPKEIGKFPFHTILVIDKSMYRGDGIDIRKIQQGSLGI